MLIIDSLHTPHSFPTRYFPPSTSRTRLLLPTTLGPQPHAQAKRYICTNVSCCASRCPSTCCCIITVQSQLLGLKNDKRSMSFVWRPHWFVVVASPLGLRLVVGQPGDKKCDIDFLSSIEVTIILDAHVLLMQNWESVSRIPVATSIGGGWRVG